MRRQMTLKQTNILIGVLVVCFAFLFILNYLTPAITLTEEPFLSQNGVEGIEVYHNHKPFVLNFEQQQQFIIGINTAKQIGLETIQPDSSAFPYEKVTCIQFGKETVTLTPISKIDNNIVFEVPYWNQNGYILEQTNGKLLRMLEQTFDH